MTLHDVSNVFFYNDTATTEIYTLSLHDALPISFLRPRRAGLLLALLLLLLETGMSLAQPWPLALALDYVLNDRKQLPGFWPEGLSAEALLLAGIAFLPFFITTGRREIGRGSLRE